MQKILPPESLMNVARGRISASFTWLSPGRATEGRSKYPDSTRKGQGGSRANVCDSWDMAVHVVPEQLPLCECKHVQLCPSDGPTIHVHDGRDPHCLAQDPFCTDVEPCHVPCRGLRTMHNGGANSTLVSTQQRQSCCKASAEFRTLTRRSKGAKWWESNRWARLLRNHT